MIGAWAASFLPKEAGITSGRLVSNVETERSYSKKRTKLVHLEMDDEKKNDFP